MMYLSIVLMAILAFVFTVLLMYGFNRRGPWNRAWTLFLVILLAIWATSLWVPPIGPIYGEVAWIPLIFIGLLITLLLAAATPFDSKSIYTQSISEKEDKASKYAIDIFFWLFMVVLGAIIILGYVR